MCDLSYVNALMTILMSRRLICFFNVTNNWDNDNDTLATSWVSSKSFQTTFLPQQVVFTLC